MSRSTSSASASTSTTSTTTTSSSLDALDDFPTAFDAATCVRRGLCPVTKLRPQGPQLFESHSLYYEQHGRGRHKIVFIMGLNSSSFSWGPQVRHFGASGFRREGGERGGAGHGGEKASSHRASILLPDVPDSDPDADLDADLVDEDEDGDGGYTILVFDNRGVGNSSTPRGPYSTSGMAEDVIELLDYLGWTAERDLNVVGISLGGMIAQELAYRIPHRIASLLLAVTTPGGYPWDNLPPLVGMLSLARLAFTPEVDKKVPTVLPMIYPKKWLEERAQNDPRGRTNYQIEAEDFIRRASITRKQSFMGHFSQMAAGLTHHVQPDRLARISARIPKLTIVTGDEDHLVRVENSFRLKAAMPEAELVQFDKTGHGIHVQRKRKFNRLVERTIKEGCERLEKGWSSRE